MPPAQVGDVSFQTTHVGRQSFGSTMVAQSADNRETKVQFFPEGPNLILVLLER